MPETIRLPARRDFVAVARSAARACLAGTPVEHDAQVVVSELFTNAVLWSRSAETGEVTLVLTLDTAGRTARIEVVDTGPAPAAAPVDELPDELRQHGRGLQIVAALAKDWGHEVGRGRQTYWAVLAW